MSTNLKQLPAKTWTINVKAELRTRAVPTMSNARSRCGVMVSLKSVTESSIVKSIEAALANTLQMLSAYFLGVGKMVERKHPAPRNLAVVLEVLCLHRLGGSCWCLVIQCHRVLHWLLPSRVLFCRQAAKWQR